MKSGDGRRMEREVEKKIEGKIMNENREAHVGVWVRKREWVVGQVGNRRRERREKIIINK